MKEWKCEKICKAKISISKKHYALSLILVFLFTHIINTINFLYAENETTQVKAAESTNWNEGIETEIPEPEPATNKKYSK